MYLSVNNHDTSTSILSLKEIGAIVIVFAFVLYLLFPKDDIEAFLESSKGHTNLSINYLESLLLYHPDNLKLKMLLIEKYDYMGKTKKALVLNSDLIKTTKDKKLLTKLYKTEYLLKKDIYFQTPNPKELRKLKEMLLKYYNFMGKNRDNLFFYAESTNIDYTYLKYISLQKLMQERPEIIDYELEKISYYLANNLGYKKDAYEHLINLLNYKEIDKKLQDYAINSLIQHKEFERAYDVVQTLFLNAKSQDERSRYFYTILYILGQSKDGAKVSTVRLIDDYIENNNINSSDIYSIINTLLQQGRLSEASYFSNSLFEEYAIKFDEKSINLALKALIYNSKLEPALAISNYAEITFHKEKYLDKSIQLSTWLGEMKNVTQLNIKGYKKYKDSKYEKYLLKYSNINNSYQILGEIYKNKIDKGNYSFIKKLSKYFDFTGEIDKAEEYFSTLLKKVKNKEVYGATIHFTFDNSHFKKGLKLYQEYKRRYGLNPSLQRVAIKRALAIKEFSKAYTLTKELNKHNKLKKKRLLVDLAWQQKDYSYLYKTLWKFEEKQQLNSTGYERLIALEKGLNRGKKIDKLYLKAWKTTHNSNNLLALLYYLSDKKEFKKFQKVLKSIKTKEKEKLSSNIGYQLLLANYYVQSHKITLALKAYTKAFKLAPNRIATHQSYLWLLLDNLKTNSTFKIKIEEELSLLKQNSQLQKKVGLVSIVSALQLKQLDVAKRWSQQLLKENPHSKEYQQLIKDICLAQTSLLNEAYEKINNDEHIHFITNVKKKHLSSLLDLEKLSFRYQWRLYQKLKANITVSKEIYNSSQEPTKTNKNIEFALKNSSSKLLWDFALAYNNSQDNFISSRLNIGYNFQPFQITLNSKYHSKSELTPILERDGMESTLGVNLLTTISPRVSLSFLHKKSHYFRQNGDFLGDGESTQLSANYTLRLGYPDIHFNSYISHNTFTPTIAQDFSEFGVSASVGTSRENSFNHGWKPFGTVGMAINDHHNVGTSLSLGLSKIVKNKDSLDVVLNYSDGVGVVSEPLYGVSVRYRF